EAAVRRKDEAPDPIVKGLRPSLLLRDPKAPALDAAFKRVGSMPLQPADLLPAGEHLKQRNAPDVIAAGQQPAVLRKGCDDVPMLVVDISWEQREQLGRGGDFTDFDVLVLIAACKHPPVRRERR